MIISPEVLTILILNGLIVIFASISLIFAIKIALYWDIDSTTEYQYRLEKRGYLVSTIIKYILSIKIPLFLFFIWTLDKTSNLITGAMCGAGVINSSDIGIYLMVIKIVNIYLFTIWLTLHNIDLGYENLKYTKLKFRLYMVLYILIVVEAYFIVQMFSGIDIDKIVSCCGTIFSSNSSKTLSTILNIDQTIIVYLFIVNYIVLIFFYIKRVKYLFGILNILFLITSIISLISFFSTYIYELPTHHCPFCLLQSDYYHIGYILYTLLFLGTLYGLLTALKKILGGEWRIESNCGNSSQ